MTLRSSSGLLSRPGTQLSLSRPSHTGTVFFHDCRHTAWISVLLLSRADISSLDAADTLSTFMLNGMPDPVRFLKLFGNLIVTAPKAAKGDQARVAIFGEMCHLLWAQGNAEAAIQVEKLGNQLVKTYDVDILCGYSLGSVQGGMDSHIFQRICAEHSAVHSR